MRFDLFLLLTIIPLVPTGALLGWRYTAMRRSAAHTWQFIAYVFTLLLQHLAVAAGIYALACVLPEPPVLGGFVVAGYSALLALDVTLFLGSGFRFELRMTKLLVELRELAADMPLKRLATVFVIWVAAALLAGTQCWHTASTETPWVYVLGGTFSALLAQSLSRRLGVAFQHGWSNPFFLGTDTLKQLVRRVLSSRSSAVLAMPQWLLSQQEVAHTIDPRYPLFRETITFTGDTHFKLQKSENERPHIVILMLESFAARDVGCLGGRYGVTSNFDALAKQGVLWTNYHANGTLTSRSAMALLYGVIAPFTEAELRHEAPARLRGLPHVLHDEGYLTASMESGTGQWEETREFNLGRGGFAQVFCQYVFRLLAPGTPFGGFSFDDRHMLDFHVDWLKKHDAAGTPTFTHLSTTTNHHPFKAPAGAAIPEHDLPEDSTYAKSLRTMMYTDKCIGDYMDKMRAAGLDKKTIFVIMGDHGNIVIDDGSGRMVSGAPCLQVSHVPLLIVAPGRISNPKSIDEVASHVDVMPTILDMLDIRTKHHGVGTSLRRVCKSRHAVTTHQFAPRFAITRFDNMRHWYAFDTEHSGLYNVDTDVRETQDLQTEHGALVRQYAKDVMAMREATDTLFKEDRLCPEEAVTPHRISTVGAPWFVPRDAQYLVQILPLMKSVDSPNKDSAFFREQQLLAIVASMDAPVDDIVTSMQVLFKHLRPAELGMLSDAQKVLVESILRFVEQDRRGAALLEAGIADREVA